MIRGQPVGLALTHQIPSGDRIVVCPLKKPEGDSVKRFSHGRSEGFDRTSMRRILQFGLAGTIQLK